MNALAPIVTATTHPHTRGRIARDLAPLYVRLVERGYSCERAAGIVAHMTNLATASALRLLRPYHAGKIDSEERRRRGARKGGLTRARRAAARKAAQMEVADAR